MAKDTIISNGGLKVAYKEQILNLEIYMDT